MTIEGSKMKSCKLKLLVSVVLILAMMTACTGGKTQSDKPLDAVLSDTAQWLLKNTAEPVYGSVGGEWVAFGFARWGGDVPQEWFDSYYEAVETYVKECGGVLNDRKYTEYSRVILALTAIGKDPTNVGGHNLLVPLADYEQTIFQGINGPIYALLALDSGNYIIPENVSTGTQATREMYVDYILSKELPGGGWCLSGGEAEIDITAMALQALAKYQDRHDVTDSINRALDVMSEQQNENGGYTAYEVDSSETVSQVIIALTELGISIEDDRFVKSGNTLKDRLLDFMSDDNGFKHLLGDETNQIATEQAFHALVALYRAEQGDSSLYRMTISE